MYACDDCGAAILSAAHRARVLAVHLFSTPKDPTLIGPFFETAMTIDEVGQTLGIVELSDLSARLVAAAKQELLSEANVAQLDSVVSRLTIIAETLGQDSSSRVNKQDPDIGFLRSTAYLAPTRHRWPRRS